MSNFSMAICLMGVAFILIQYETEVQTAVQDLATIDNFPAMLNQISRLICAVLVEIWQVLSPKNVLNVFPLWKTILRLLLYYKSIRLFYFLNFQMLEYNVDLEDVGYITEKHEKKRNVANLIQRMRTVGDVPPVYPNGWFGVMESHKLPKQQAKSIILLGKNLAVFRDEKEEVFIIDAYCKHNGANLAAGGRVKDGCIECPFHGWWYNGSDGKCVKIPYMDKAGKIPQNAHTKSYIVHEINGWIHLWFDAEDREPYWRIPEILEISDGSLRYCGRTQHKINSHIEEVPENGTDVAHLSVVHGQSLLTGIDLRYMYSWLSKYMGNHIWEAQWNQDENEKHIGIMRLKHFYRFFGVNIKPLSLELLVRQIGPGIVYLNFKSMFGNAYYIQYLTPVEPLIQSIVHNIYVGWSIPNILAKVFLYGEAKQVERDIMIWNNKRFVINPVYVKSNEDQLILKHRRWYSQFYSEHSPRLTMQSTATEASEPW